MGLQRFLLTGLFTLSVLTTITGCSTIQRTVPFFRPQLKPNVVLAYQEQAAQVHILIKDMDIPVTMHPPGQMPYTHNSHAALWVGRQFPYNKLSEILEFVRNYYRDLHYVDLSDEKNGDIPIEEHYRLFIGGSTNEALRRGLRAWTPGDFDRLRAVKSQAEMIQVIESLNRPKKP